MLLVLLTWFYLFFTLTNLGFGLAKMTRIKPKHFFFNILLGLVATTILATIWAIFGGINWGFHVFLLVFQALYLPYFKDEITTLYCSIWQSLRFFSRQTKAFLLAVTLLILAQSARAIQLVDNETYYVQTIKWLTEFGFVKGLSNLHIFFGQTNGWHILQSVFSFSFFGNCYNDLNGFCLLMAILFGASFWNADEKNLKRPDLIVAIFPLVIVLLFPFLGAPSPDFAVYLLSYFVFYYFLKTFESTSVSDFNLIFILSSFIVFVKVTALPILLVPLLLWVVHFKKLASKIFSSYLMGLLLLCLLVIKNTILTGYPFFPSNIVVFDFSYALPNEVYQFSFNPAKRYDFFISSQEFRKLGGFAILLKWIFDSKIYSIFNGILIVLIIGIPVYLKQFLNQRKYWMLYLIMMGQCLFLFATSPQYRFFLHFELLFGLLVLTHFFRTRKWIRKMSYWTLIPLSCVVIFSQQLKSNFQDHLKFKEESFTMRTLLYPAENSQLKTQYHETKMGNLQYTSPDCSAYIWATGNGNLPCVSDTQIKYLKSKTGYAPQLRTNVLKDGFYSQKCTTR